MFKNNGVHHFAYADVIGAECLIYFSISEGKEAFEKAKEIFFNVYWLIISYAIYILIFYFLTRTG
jgi:hypothetical protein